MSAVVQTGSRDARSACGTKVMVFCDSVRPICGMARVAVPASADFRKLRRLIRKVLSLSRPAHINHISLKSVRGLHQIRGIIVYRIAPGRDGIVVDRTVQREELGIPAKLALFWSSALTLRYDQCQPLTSTCAIDCEIRIQGAHRQSGDFGEAHN